MLKAYSRTFSLTIAALAVAGILLTGCQKKEEPKEPAPQAQVDQPAAPDTSMPKDTVKPAETKAPAAELKGTYSGMFDNRAATLKITSQDGNSFKGTISINYREAINQEISGTFNPDTKSASFKDLLHSRYAGSYSAKFSDDLKKLNGTFTQNVEKTKVSFSLSKK